MSVCFLKKGRYWLYLVLLLPKDFQHSAPPPQPPHTHSHHHHHSPLPPQMRGQLSQRSPGTLSSGGGDDTFYAVLHINSSALHLRLNPPEWSWRRLKGRGVFLRWGWGSSSSPRPCSTPLPSTPPTHHLLFNHWIQHSHKSHQVCISACVSVCVCVCVYVYVPLHALCLCPSLFPIPPNTHTHRRTHFFKLNQQKNKMPMRASLY